MENSEEKDRLIANLIAERDALKNVLLGDEEQLKRVVDQNAALRDALVSEHQAGELREQALARDLAAALAERDALRETIQWALDNATRMDHDEAYSFKAELRRRADAAKGGKG